MSKKKKRFILIPKFYALNNFKNTFIFDRDFN